MDIIKKSKEWALEEIKKFDGPPSVLNFNTSLEKGSELAEKLNADKNIVILGCILMDIKLGECKNKGIIKEHIVKSVEAAEEFLKQFDLEQETIKKITACIAEHHGSKEFTCIESEICANADCYRFIYPRNVFDFVADNVRKGMTIQESLEFAYKKLEEKYNIISLDIVKKELEPYYQKFNN